MWVLEVEAESTALHLIQGEWTLGRSGNVINFPKDKSISRSHAEFHVGGLEDLENVNELPSFVVIDKKSRFGTFLNDVQLSPDTPMALRAGDRISFGAKTTVLRVRYYKMVARTSRIHKANRKKLLDGCKAIGMHVVNTSVDDLNFCITDPGKFVATEKVLWALVHNQAIVTSEWVQAVLRRKSLADDLPRPEEFVPKQDANDLVDEKAPSYKSDPRRLSLYAKYMVVFLAPSSMEPLVPVMGGEVVKAYQTPDIDSDDTLAENLRKTSRKVLVVYPPSSGGEGAQSEKQSMSKANSTSGREWDPSILRRLHKLQQLNFAIVLHQELAASIIFTTPPQCLSDDSVSHILGPSQSVFEVVHSTPFHTHDELVHASKSSIEVAKESSIPPTEGLKVQETAPSELRKSSFSHTVEDTRLTPPQPITIREVAEVIDHEMDNHETAESQKDEADSRGKSSPPRQVEQSVHDKSVDHEKDKSVDESSIQIVIDEHESPPPRPRVENTGKWLSKLVKRSFAQITDDNDEPVVAAQITVTPLVFRRPLLNEEAPRYLSRNAEPQRSGLLNTKRFRKNYVVTSRRLITHFTNEVPVSLERQREFQKHREELESRERLAEALFENNILGSQRKTTSRRA